jgi:hypothetical protein
VIGYSDGRNFAVGVGPSPATSQSEGRFADLVQPVIVRKAPAPELREKHPGAIPVSPTPESRASGGARELPKKARAISPRTKARMAADALRIYGARHQHLYDALPAAREKSGEMNHGGAGPGFEPSPSGGPATLYASLPPAKGKPGEVHLNTPQSDVELGGTPSVGASTPAKSDVSDPSGSQEFRRIGGRTIPGVALPMGEHGTEHLGDAPKGAGAATVEVEDDMFAVDDQLPPDS